MKHLLGHTLFAAHLDAVLLRNAAVVVAFHRVDDADRSDTLTVDARMFERYCMFFRRHFRVVPLREIVQKLERGLEPNRELAITFDDGYRDNYDNAMPVLEAVLPATFFVVSQWIGTDVVPRWDERRGVRHPWMTWDQVRSLHRRGFEIGAHTQHHVDLGQVDAAEARDEIAGARLSLERQLAARVDLFAYPPTGGTTSPTRTGRWSRPHGSAVTARTSAASTARTRIRSTCSNSDLSVVPHLTSLASTWPWGGASSPAVASMPRHSMAGDRDRLPSSVSRVE
jgi:peptidoglycan/xylan/chitin deacetylase (PgdA/CDA1 family)